MKFLKKSADFWNSLDTFDRIFIIFTVGFCAFFLIALTIWTKGILLLVIAAFYFVYKLLDKFFKTFEGDDE